MRKIVFTLLLIFLYSCDYTPIYSSGDAKFKINEIELKGNKKVNKIVLRQISRLKQNNSSLIYDLKINSSKEIKSVSKDEKGETKILEMSVSLNIDILRNNVIIKNKNISENFSYNNNENKFTLNQYEKDIQNKLVEKIVDNLILSLETLE
tara:strand:+ start:793 stop:1245 length:453 start_codon:yes stop_codon:yes gene_type:complete